MRGGASEAGFTPIGRPWLRRSCFCHRLVLPWCLGVLELKRVRVLEEPSGGRERRLSLQRPDGGMHRFALVAGAGPCVVSGVTASHKASADQIRLGNDCSERAHTHTHTHT